MSSDGEAGGLELLARLGAGGQGEVFLARPWVEGTRRRLAGKLLLRARMLLRPLASVQARRLRLGAVKLARPAMADSLHDEHGHLATHGLHQHLPRLYSAAFLAGDTADIGFTRARGAARLYLALAYEVGTPLSTLLALGRRQPGLWWSLAVAAQVAEALAHLHAHGIIHHDVRPANILVRPGPHVVLLDLGAAEVMGSPRRRAVYGVSGWLPPERKGPRPMPASPLTDIYAVGLLLRALTEQGAVPSDLARLISDASAPDPAHRGAAFPSASALRTALLTLALRHGCVR